MTELRWREVDRDDETDDGAVKVMRDGQEIWCVLESRQMRDDGCYTEWERVAL